MCISLSAILHFQFCLPVIKNITQYFNITVRTTDLKVKKQNCYASWNRAKLLQDVKQQRMLQQTVVIKVHCSRV